MSEADGSRTKFLRGFLHDRRGAGAIEFGVTAGFLCIAMLNMVDVATYAYEQMQVANAAEMGAQAAWKTCDQSKLPATTNCPALKSAVSDAIHGTSLGDDVSLIEGSPAEGYYCINSSNALVKVSTASSKPSDCSSVGMPSLRPGDYIEVKVTYSYSAMFLDFTVANLLATPIVKTALLRLG
jgi:Flp pilus assembly protein TadG